MAKGTVSLTVDPHLGVPVLLLQFDDHEVLSGACDDLAEVGVAHGSTWFPNYQALDGAEVIVGLVKRTEGSFAGTYSIVGSGAGLFRNEGGVLVNADTRPVELRTCRELPLALLDPTRVLQDRLGDVDDGSPRPDPVPPLKGYAFDAAPWVRATRWGQAAGLFRACGAGGGAQ